MNCAQSITLNRPIPTVARMSMGTRLQEALDVRGRSASEVIKACELSKGAVYNILNDVTKPEKVRADTVGKICAYLRISRDWLVWGKGGMDLSDRPLADEHAWANIRDMKLAAALGDGTTPDDYAETSKLKFRRDSLHRKKLKPESLIVIYGSGDSMHPTIKNGDAILVDTSDKVPKDGKLFVITYDGLLIAKRLMELDGAWYAKSDNDADPKWRKPRKLDPSRGIEIAGRIRWVAGWVD